VSSEFKHMVRLAGKDVKGTKNLLSALSEIKGIGIPSAMAILNYLGMNPRQRVGSLSDQQLSMLEEAVKNFTALKVPEWALNRRRDLETGANLHLIGSDLELAIKSDIDREKRIGSWRGVRHAWGLKVRGQRTRTTGRKGMVVGVRKSAKLK